MKARPYQQEAVRSVLQEWKEKQSTLVVMPTGTGKTILFSHIIRACFPRKALVLAHRRELIQQAADKVHRVTGYRCEIEMGDLRAQMDGDMWHKPQVVVSSIQTQAAGGDGGGRMGRFNPHDFGLLIIDEAHRSVGDSYRRTLDYYKANPNLKILGVTATPDRADEEALGQIFESVAYDYEILDAIHDGWLVPVEQQMIHVAGLDYSGVGTTAGDLNQGDLADVVEQERNLHGIAHPTIDLAGDRRAIVFCASVKQAERMAEIFNRHKPGSGAWVCGKTDKEDRNKINRDFAAGEIQFLCNVGTHTEGFDDPGVSIVAMARATKSRSLYAQMAGRAMRPDEAIASQLGTIESADERRDMILRSKKPTCLVIDFVGNSGRHKLVTTADILGGNVSDDAIARAVQEARKSGKAVRMDELLDKKEEELHKEAEERKKREVANRIKMVARAKYTTQTVSPFDVFDIHPVKERGWDSGRQISEKQRDLLLKQGINPEGMPYSAQKQLLNEIFRRFSNNLCSYKQAAMLKKRGLDGNVSREQASKMIDEIAKKEGWGK